MMEENGGEVPAGELDKMSEEQVKDVIHAAEEAARKAAEEVEAERRRVDAMPDGPEKDEAMKKLAEAEADAERKAAEAEKMKEYEHDREEKAVQRYVCRQSTCNAMYVCGTIRDLL